VVFVIDRGCEGVDSVPGATGSVPGESGLTLRLLGAWRLNDGSDEVATSLTMRRLLTLLALQGPTHRFAAAALLWPDSESRRAAGSMRELLWRTRQAHPDLIAVGRDTIALARTVRVDVRVLRAAVDQLHRRSPRTAGLPDGVVDLCTAGELLPGWSEPWVEAEREQLRQLQQLGLELHAAHRLAHHRPDEALPIALAATAAEPLRESAQRMVVRAHLAMGNYSQAVTQFERYSERLDDELGVRPSREFADLLRQRVVEGDDPTVVIGRFTRTFDRAHELAVAVDF
jgi:DNA-binding SARP family transcriptional activator